MYPEYMELQGNKRSGTLYKEIIKLQQENQQLKKQKDDVVEYIKSLQLYGIRCGKTFYSEVFNGILRMLGEIE